MYLLFSNVKYKITRLKQLHTLVASSYHKKSAYLPLLYIYTKVLKFSAPSLQ